MTALALFNSGGLKLLRASTYGRGVWEFNLLAKPDFQIAVSNTPLTVFVSENAVFNGTLSAVNGYDSTVGLSCIAGSSSPPNPCVPSPATLTPTPDGAAFSVSAGSAGVADYYFNVQGVGFDPNSTTHVAALTLHVVNWSMTTPVPGTVNEPRGATSPPVSFQIAAQGTLSQSVGLSCSFTPSIPGATCNFTPGASFNLSTGSPVNATATVTVPVGITTGSYGVNIQASTAGATLTTSFIANVVPNPTFVLSLTNVSFPNAKAGTSGTTGSITIASQDAFTGTVNLSCVSTFGSGSCSISPTSVSVALPPAAPATATLTINGTSFSAGSYEIAVQGTSGSTTNSLEVPFNVGDYVIAGPATLAVVPGGSAMANLTFTSIDSYSGTVSATCDSTALTGAQCTLSPVSPFVISSGAVVAVIATIIVPNGSAPGSYIIKVNTQDAAGEPSHIWTTALSVQDFTFSAVTPPTNTAGSGQTVSYSLSVLPVGASFANAIGLSCSGAPANSTCSVSPNSVTPGNSPAAVVVTIATTAGTAQGSYSLVVSGASGLLSHSVTFPLTIANSFTLAVTQPFPTGVDAGSQSVAAKVSVTPDYSGFASATCDAVALSGTQCTLTPANPIAISGSPVTLTVLINIPNNAVPGTYNIGVNVQDSSGAPSHLVTIPFTVIQDYNIANLSAISQTISAGQSITYNLSVSPVGGSYSNPVTLSCKVSPSLAGSACSFSPNPAELQSGPAAVVMTVTTQAASGQSWLPRVKAGPWLYAIWLAFTAVAVWGTTGRRRWSPALLLAFVFCLIIYLPSCGGSGQNGGSSNPGGNTTQGIPITYTITVVGSPASISQSNGASVTLIVQ